MKTATLRENESIAGFGIRMAAELTTLASLVRQSVAELDAAAMHDSPTILAFACGVVMRRLTDAIAEPDDGALS